VNQIDPVFIGKICETCGAQALCLVRDSKELPPKDVNGEKFERREFGPPRFYCHAHRRKPVFTPLTEAPANG
jgi:hypothetical protein